MQDMRRMQIGSIVDFIIDYNDRQKQSEEQETKGTIRKATQADIDAFFG